MTHPPSENLPPSGGKELPAGTRIEEFIIEKVLGSGGFGITYLAKDTSLGRQVVIKENLPSQFAHRDTTSLTVWPGPGREDQENFRWSLENFSREAATLASLRHPGIVPVLRRFEAFGTAYFVMPFVEGVTLDELLESRRAKKQSFSEDELRGLLEHVLAALDHLHDRGIYHRDIKPGNILITDEGIPVLIDFGSARQRLGERSMTVVESAGYTPFEQLQSRGNIGPWSDLYALGGTIEKSITGETPPKAMDRMRRDPRIPLTQRPDLAARYSFNILDGIDQALAVEETERWQNAGEWLAALRGRPATVVHSSDSEKVQRSQTQRTPKTQRIDSSIPTKMGNPLPWIIAACVILGLWAWGMVDATKTEAAKVEVAKVEAAKVEAAEVEAARVEAARVEAARVEAARVEAARVEAAALAAAEAKAKRIEAEKEAAKMAEQQRLADLEAAEAAKVTKVTKDQPFVNSLGMKFVPAGTSGVLFGTCLTRVKDFEAFVDASGYDAIQNSTNGMPAYTLEKEGDSATWKQAGGTWKDPRFPPGHGQTGEHPVVCVSYLDAEAFCAWLTKRDAAKLPSGWHYRLPTDEEWSTACGPTEFPWGENFPPGPKDGNYSGTETMIGPLQGLADEFSKAGRTDGWARTSPVGSFIPNRYGLSDMGGNAWEWCGTWYKASMNDAKTLEAIPALKEDGGGQTSRVLRGGSWRNYVRVFLRSACRGLGGPRNRVGDYGFRVVLVGGAG